MKRPPVAKPLEVRYRDLDTLGHGKHVKYVKHGKHVNSTAYLKYFETVRFAGLVEGDVPGGDARPLRSSERRRPSIAKNDGEAR